MAVKCNKSLEIVIILFILYIVVVSYIYYFSPVTVSKKPNVRTVSNHVSFQLEGSNDSLCSKEATDHGLHQKVISFTLFLNPKNSTLPPDLKYFKGVQSNILRAQLYYPEWLVRIYTYPHPDFDRPLLDIVTNNSGVFFCNIENIPTIGNMDSILDSAMWRYLPMFDPTVDVFISRDLDSAFRPRELTAVNQWLVSNKVFHAMRDHPFHVEPILAGLWGAKTAQINTTMKSLYKKITFDYGTVNGSYFHRGHDQNFLAKHIYPLIKNDLMSHDSFHCNSYADAVPYPVQRTNSTDFVGNYEYSPDAYPISKECPVECRPSFGKNWEFC